MKSAMQRGITKKILIVEDEVIIADTLAMLLSQMGYEVPEPVLNYDGAVVSLTKESFDLAIIDINLQTSKSGIDLANWIRKSERPIPFIFLTSNTDNQSLNLALEAEPVGYLVKPYQKETLYSMIELGLRRNIQKLNSEGKELLSTLTPSELQIIKLIAEQLTTKEIADQLQVSQSTVKNHRHNICAKLNLPHGTHSLITWVLNNRHSLA